MSHLDHSGAESQELEGLNLAGTANDKNIIIPKGAGHPLNSLSA